MAQTTVPAAVAAPAPARIDAVGTLINQAGQAAGTMLAKCKEAAQAAAAQLNPAQPMGERIAAVVALYAADFVSAGHNVKSLFVDALTLHAAAQCPVSVTAIGADGKKVEQHVTAADAVNMSKHAMKDAVKQVREAHGIGRKAGGGRKAAAPAAPAPGAEVKTEVDAFVAWLDNLEAYLTDAVYHPRIVARLIEQGYRLEKAVKGKVIKGAASA